MASPESRLVDFYHFTCRHSDRHIRNSRSWLKPITEWRALDAIHATKGLPPTGLAAAPGVIWLTDLPDPSRECLGLTSHLIACDRMEICYRVRTRATPWVDFAATYGANREWQQMLTGEPRHWFVVTEPVFALTRAVFPRQAA